MRNLSKNVSTEAYRQAKNKQFIKVCFEIFQFDINEMEIIQDIWLALAVKLDIRMNLEKFDEFADNCATIAHTNFNRFETEFTDYLDEDGDYADEGIDDDCEPDLETDWIARNGY